MLLRFVKSCLRGEAALWWEGCILSYGDDQDQGPAENYAAFKVAFKQHYGIGGATNNLCWADTSRQRSDEDIREYFLRACAELGNHLKESTPLLYGKPTRQWILPPTATTQSQGCGTGGRWGRTSDKTRCGARRLRSA